MKTFRFLLTVAVATIALAGQSQTLEDTLAMRTPKDAWIDPITAVPSGCEYVLYPTNTRGEGTEGSLLVYLPPQYYTDSDRRFPVIYYLHGGTGNQRECRWMVERIDKAILAGKIQPLIIVGVQALPVGWYLNGRMEDPKVSTGPIEDVLMHDMIPYVDSHYRTIASREGRALEGFSMGGGATLRLAFKYPEVFGAASSVAGAVVHWTEEPLRHALECTFGDVDDPASKAYFDSQIPEVYAERNTEQIISSGMMVRMFIGTEDRLYQENGVNITQRMSDYLTALGIPHDLYIIPGANHNPWEMFDSNHLSYDCTFWAKAFNRSN
ncbi:MAG: hypothetical protein LUD17_12295 [Bacteroidales bacterium]|nr:hypothetical protein [Bacteroidales bacterium]